MEEQSRFLHELRGYLMDHWDAFGLPGSPAGISYRMRQAPKGRATEQSRLVALWFGENPEEPRVATKWILNRNFSSFIVQEYQHSRWLYDTKRFRSMPRPLGCPEIEGCPVLVEEAIPGGRSFAHQIIGLPYRSDEDKRRAAGIFKDIFAQAGEILAKIQDPLSPASGEEILSELEPYLAKAAKVLTWDAAKTEKVRRALGNSPADPVPGSGEAFLIGDFAPQNLLSGPSGVFLIELEFSKRSLLTFLDPLSFVNSVFRFVVYPSPENGADATIRAFEDQLLRGKDPLGGLAGDFLGSRGIPKERQEWHWLVFLVHEAAFQYFLNGAFSESYRNFFNDWIDSVVDRL